MNVGDWVLYEAVHYGAKKRVLGKVRHVAEKWLDITCYWTDRIHDNPLYTSANLMRKYCTPITKEVADLIIYSHNEKE